MTVAIQVDDLSKQYRIGSSRRANTLAAQMGQWLRGRAGNGTDILWALNGVRFEVNEGEVFGIVGRNGSGKSTLLKILAGISRPTRGHATVRGRVGALIEVGTGFHPELSGRENIFFNGILLGMDSDEVRRKFDEIVAFAGLEKFIDTPIKYYSSGMHARLGFAVAANLRPEILIVDEVLSVGDVLFQQKSMGQMEVLTKSGITVLFVSHNLGAVASACKSGLLLDKGEVKAIGKITDVLGAYIGAPAESDARISFADPSDMPAVYSEAWLAKADGVPSKQFDLAEDIWLHLRYVVKAPLPGLQLSVLLQSGYENLAQSFDTDAHAFLGVHPAGVFEKRLRIHRMFLKEGSYSIGLSIGIPTELYEYHRDVISFEVIAESIDTQSKSYRRDRQGGVIFQGEWFDAAK